MVARSLNIFAKAEYNSDNFEFEFFLNMVTFMEKENVEKGFAGHAIRILVKMISVPALAETFKIKILSEHYNKIATCLS